jgi:hypothetical protein
MGKALKRQIQDEHFGIDIAQTLMSHCWPWKTAAIFRTMIQSLIARDRIIQAKNEIIYPRSKFGCPMGREQDKSGFGIEK